MFRSGLRHGSLLAMYFIRLVRLAWTCKLMPEKSLLIPLVSHTDV